MPELLQKLDVSQRAATDDHATGPAAHAERIASNGEASTCNAQVRPQKLSGGLMCTCMSQSKRILCTQ